MQVSKDPLQVYIDGVTGALKYTKIGWLPPNAIAISFYHTGNNPLGLVDPSPSYLSWPSTVGNTFYGFPWALCPLGTTKQYQVFINSDNFGIGGVSNLLELKLDPNHTDYTFSPQVLPRMNSLAPLVALPPSTPTPGSRKALLHTTLPSLTLNTLAKVTTRAVFKCLAARITTRGQAALFKESHACSLLSYIPSVIAPYRSLSFPSCILSQIEYECGFIDSQTDFYPLLRDYSKSTLY